MNSAREYRPPYLDLHESGELRRRADALAGILSHCHLCPHGCGIDRTAGERGFCRAPSVAFFSAAYPHHGNERAISGYAGSGNIFLTYCNSRCVFCQNSNISQAGDGEPVTVHQLASIYLTLQDRGCHNLDLVSPIHFLPQLVSALAIAVEGGFRLPIVYNTNGYDSVEVLRLLDGIIDIYLPDMKFSDEPTARRLTGMKDYPDISRAAVAEMFRQVGPLQLDDKGIAYRGLIVRHLVMPDGISGATEVLRSIAAIDPGITVNIMAQYHPAHRAREYPGIDRRITRDEYAEAVAAAHEVGLRNIWTQ